MKIKTPWNTTVDEINQWPEWKSSVWLVGRIAFLSSVIVGVVLAATWRLG